MEGAAGCSIQKFKVCLLYDEIIETFQSLSETIKSGELIIILAHIILLFLV